MTAKFTENDQVSSLVAQLIRPQVQALHAYKVQDASGLVKLDAMENPFGWPAEMLAGWQQIVASLALNRYPDPTAFSLKKELANTFTLPAGLDILLGNGSDEIIQLLAMAVARPGAVLMSPEPGFVMYRLIAEFTGMQYVGVNLNTDWDLDLPAMLKAIGEHRPALIFLALPNNPTGNLFSEKSVEAIVEATPGLVVLDEAYTAFTDADYIGWAERYPNVLVMRTLSKVGLAGLRLGMLFGQSKWLAELDKLRLPYNTGVLTQAAAIYALQHFDVLQQQTSELRRQRAWLSERLARFDELDVYPSEANFVVVKLYRREAVEVWQQLRDAGILVKNLDGSHASLQRCLRITVGSAVENEQLLAAMSQILT